MGTYAAKRNLSAVFTDRISLFEPACTLHSFFCATSRECAYWQRFDGEKSSNGLKLEFQRVDDNSLFWQTISVGGVTLQAAITSWAASRSGTTVRLSDTCRGFNCNPTCPNDIRLTLSDSGSQATYISAIALTSAVLGVIVVIDLFFMYLYQQWVPSLVCGSLPPPDHSKDFSGDVLTTRKGVTTSLANDRYAVVVKNLSYCPMKPSSKHSLLLSDVSVSFRSKRLTGIMGKRES
jgi:hypothetical protein